MFFHSSVVAIALNDIVYTFGEQQWTKGLCKDYYLTFLITLGYISWWRIGLRPLYYFKRSRSEGFRNVLSFRDHLKRCEWMNMNELLIDYIVLLLTITHYSKVFPSRPLKLKYTVPLLIIWPTYSVTHICNIVSDSECIYCNSKVSRSSNEGVCFEWMALDDHESNYIIL